VVELRDFAQDDDTKRPIFKGYIQRSEIVIWVWDAIEAAVHTSASSVYYGAWLTAVLTKLTKIPIFLNQGSSEHAWELWATRMDLVFMHLAFVQRRQIMSGVHSFHSSEIGSGSLD
jgi:hypothetical protein